MQTDSVTNICSGLMNKAIAEHFLDHSILDIEKTANTFVYAFAKDNGLTAHNLSAFRWYFQSGSVLMEGGLVELTSDIRLFQHNANCAFRVVDIAEIDSLKHLYEV